MALVRTAVAFFCVLLAFTAFTASARAMSSRPPEPEYIPGQIVVRFHETVDSARSVEIVKAEGARIKTVLRRTRLHLIILPEGISVEDAVERFLRYPEVLSAEPNYRAEMLEDK